MLVGREDELALVDALLANPGDALLLHGDPGVGKSAIAAATISRAGAAGATVLTTTGMPSETEVPYTSLQPLLWPVLDDADGLPAPSARRWRRRWDCPRSRRRTRSGRAWRC